MTREQIDELLSKVSLDENEKCKKDIQNCSWCVDVGNCPYDRLLEQKRFELYKKLK